MNRAGNFAHLYILSLGIGPSGPTLNRLPLVLPRIRLPRSRQGQTVRVDRFMSALSHVIPLQLRVFVGGPSRWSSRLLQPRKYDYDKS
jgi:hypothetical protein